MTRGLLDSGVTVLRGVDIDLRLRETYERNNSPAKFLHADVRDLSGTGLRAGLTLNDYDFLILAGCAPCQPFTSMITKKRRDPRLSLISHFERLVEEVKPDAVILENVPGLKGPKGRRVWNRLTKKLEGLGFKVEWSVIDAKDYGVPQTRKRLILLAGKGLRIPIPAPTHGPNGLESNRYPTVHDAIRCYPPIRAGGKSTRVQAHVAGRLSRLNLLRVRLVPKDGGSLSDIPKRLWVKCRKRHPRSHAETYGRMSWNKPAPTLTCKCTSLSNGRFGHPSQDRPVSIREAATLQTFPVSYFFPEMVGLSGFWIGNAIPVRLAESLGKAVLKAMFGRQPRAVLPAPLTVNQ